MSDKLISDQFDSSIEGVLLGRECRIYDEGGHDPEQSEFICRAVNCHNEMRSLMGRLLDEIEQRIPEYYFQSGLVTECDELFKKIDGQEEEIK